jgi:hypothetical protein
LNLKGVEKNSSLYLTFCFGFALAFEFLDLVAGTQISGISHHFWLLWRHALQCRMNVI